MIAIFSYKQVKEEVTPANPEISTQAPPQSQ